MTLPPRIDSLLARVLPAWVDRALVVKAVSFALIGCVNATVDFVVFSIRHLYFGLPIIPANLISWCVAVTNSYVLNSMFTFAAESGRRLTFKALRHVRGDAGRRADREHHHGVRGVLFHSGPDRKAARDRRELRGRFHAVASAGVPAARGNAAALSNGDGRLVYDENLTVERPTFVTHLECSYTGERYPADEVHNLSRAGKPLLVRYDLDGVRKALTKEALAQRPPDFWRYRELLPVRRAADIVSLGEAITPLVPLPRLAARPGASELIVKDEGRLPTGSFKARGLALAVSMAKALGIKHMAMPTNGNAGAALAAYASHCGIKTTIFCPEDTPEVNVSEIALQGAAVYRVNGLIDDCGKIVGEGKAKVGWFDTSTLKEPYRIEGKKTMGLELAEQLGWDVPDVILYPTGGGTGLIGMWKAFAELEAIGFIGKKRPRMVAVQAVGLRADGARLRAGRGARAALGECAHHRGRHPRAAGGRRFPDPARGAREQRLSPSRSTDEAITAALDEVAREEGFLMCPEGAATYAAWKQGLADGRIRQATSARVLFNCATGLKYPLPPIRRTLDRHKPIDFASL